ncbi:hypothetical protein SVIOM342S_03562 [Streptomyces violaceorubidus]
MTWIFLALGAWLRNPEAVTAQGVGYLVTFPLMFASSAFVPKERLPDSLQLLATVNPLSYAMEANRALALDQPLGGQVWLCAGRRCPGRDRRIDRRGTGVPASARLKVSPRPQTGTAHPSERRRHRPMPGTGTGPLLRLDATEAPPGAAVDWLTDRRPEIREAVARNGAVLVRGLRLDSRATAAAAVGRVIGDPLIEREGFAPRDTYGQGVYSSSHWPAHQPMCMRIMSSVTPPLPPG